MSLSFLMHKYRILGKKGEGTFSEVLKCQNVKDGSLWACKKMKQHYDSSEQVNNLREIQALRRLSPHPNILELHEVAFDKKSGTLVLICELMDMNIYELIRGKHHMLPEKRVKHYMFQLCKALDHMHRNGIFHRDVKPENILIKEDLLKLADFGSCRSVYSKQPYTEYISTRWYRAPECLLTDGFYTYKMDIWSVGCVFFEVMSLHPLFPGSNEVDQIAKIHDVMGTPDPNVLNKLRNKTRGMNFNFPQKKGSGIEKSLPHASKECIELIYLMCTYDPDERISAKQALKHSYFKEFRDAERRAAAAASKARKAAADEVTTKESYSEHPIKLNDISHDVNANRVTESKASSGVVTTILQREPLYKSYQREKRDKRYKKRSESGPNMMGSSMYLPQMSTQPGVKPKTFHPTFLSHSYTGSSVGLPKIKEPSITTTTFPTFNTFMKPANTKSPTQATKNMYGRYQLPPIESKKPEG